jgi:hypothetical protein
MHTLYLEMNLGYRKKSGNQRNLKKFNVKSTRDFPEMKNRSPERNQEIKEIMHN